MEKLIGMHSEARRLHSRGAVGPTQLDCAEEPVLETAMDERTKTTGESTRAAADGAKQQHMSTAKELMTKSAHVVTDAIAAEATERAQVAMGVVTQEGNALAKALENAAAQAERDGARLVHAPLRSIAAVCQSVADRSHNEGPQQLIADIEDFGRREPIALFAAAAALGFLGTRALRAGAQARALTSNTGRS